MAAAEQRLSANARLTSATAWDFLGRVRWAKVWLEFRALERVRLPPFCGPAIRGALGYAFREALCERRPPCKGACEAPESCRYHWLFERTSADSARSGNRPKPYILTVPVPPGLECIVQGSAVVPPYRVVEPAQTGEPPRLQNDAHYLLLPETPLRVGLTLLGQAIALAVPMIEYLARRGLYCGGAWKLERAVDAHATEAVLFDAASPVPTSWPRTQLFSPSVEPEDWRVNRLRVFFRTPVLIKLEDGPCFKPERIASVFAEQAMVRVVRVYNAFAAQAGERLPLVEAPGGLVRLAGYRLFRYVLPRLSFRQDRWMRFDGLVGYIDLEGKLGELMPLFRAVEVLHVGQKATFGLGEVRCRPLLNGVPGSAQPPKPSGEACAMMVAAAVDAAASFGHKYGGGGARE